MLEETTSKNHLYDADWIAHVKGMHKNASFKKWAVKFIERFRKKWRSGLILNAYVPTVKKSTFNN